MFTPEEILQIAQAIQPRLQELLPSDIAETIDRQLTDHLAQANAGESVAQEILDLLNTQEALRPYLGIAIETAIPKHYEPLGGEPPPFASSLTYKCPECDYTDTIPQQGMTPEPCPDHPNAILQLF